jgi:hypothetical protein
LTHFDVAFICFDRQLQTKRRPQSEAAVRKRGWDAGRFMRIQLQRIHGSSPVIAQLISAMPVCQRSHRRLPSWLRLRLQSSFVNFKYEVPQGNKNEDCYRLVD